MAGVVWLVLASGFGLTLTWVDPGSALGNRIAGTYGVLGLLGWISNFIIGMSYQIFPGFVVGARAAAGWTRLTIADLSFPSAHPLVFFLLNLGVLMLATGLLVAQGVLACLGTIVIAGGGLVYVSVMARTLSYAYYRAVPRTASHPLRALPHDSASL